MKILLSFLILCSINGNYGIQVGQSNAIARENYNNFGSGSVSFILGLENYSNQQLQNPQYLDYYGYVHDRPQPIAPGFVEYMTAKKSSWTFRGVSGVVSWDIGNTNKMVVVMYEKPWSAVLHTNTLAVGIFPKGDLSGFFNKMYSGEEQSFRRDNYPDADGWSRPVRYTDEPDFMVSGDMADAPKGNIAVRQQLVKCKTNLRFNIFRLTSIQNQLLALQTHLMMDINS